MARTNAAKSPLPSIVFANDANTLTGSIPLFRIVPSVSRSALFAPSASSNFSSNLLDVTGVRSVRAFGLVRVNGSVAGVPSPHSCESSRSPSMDDIDDVALLSASCIKSPLALALVVSSVATTTARLFPSRASRRTFSSILANAARRRAPVVGTSRETISSSTLSPTMDTDGPSARRRPPVARLDVPPVAGVVVV